MGDKNKKKEPTLEELGLTFDYEKMKKRIRREKAQREAEMLGRRSKSDARKRRRKSLREKAKEKAKKKSDVPLTLGGSKGQLKKAMED